MKLLLLAAGYGTRLYPLTRNRAKPLLEVAGVPMIERIIALFAGVPQIDGTFIVTNHRFAADFEAWAAGYRSPLPGELRVFDDGTTTDENKLGAIGDIRFVLDAAGVGEDLLVVAGDNLFDTPLDGFVARGGEQGCLIGVYDVGDLERVRQYNHIVVDGHGRVVEFEEKPPRPKSTRTAICLYSLPAATLPLVSRYLEAGGNPDAPGYYIEWLHRQVPVYTYRIAGIWFDLGTMASYEEANRVFGANS